MTRNLHRAIVCRGFLLVSRGALEQQLELEGLARETRNSFVGRASAGKAGLFALLCVREALSGPAQRLSGFCSVATGTKLPRPNHGSTMKIRLQCIDYVQKSGFL